MTAATGNKRLTVMVSSTVYGIEELLEQIYATLTTFGYDVWMSHKGTLPVSSTRTAFENCLHGVANCDLFLSLITPQYGSGVEAKGELSITHQELLKAIELNKPRWVLAHDHVVFARTMLMQLEHDTAAKRAALAFKKGKVMDDLRVIDMYEAAIRHDVHMPDRKGNWVQKFVNPDEALLYASAQFFRYQEAERFITEHLSDPQAVARKIKERKLP
jgi:hypothetical protein